MFSLILLFIHQVLLFFFSPTFWCCRKEIDVENANLGQDVGNEEVRPPLPVKREVLYDDASLYRYPMQL